MAPCIKCLADVEHIWHDQGTLNKAHAHHWAKGGKHAGPVHNTDEQQEDQAA